MDRTPHTGLTRAAFLKLSAAAAIAVAAPRSQAFAAASLLTTRPIPRSKNGETLPVIGLGTAQDFGARKDVEAKAQVIKELLDGGGKIIDTAANYAGGSSEELIGELLDNAKSRDRAFIATKFQENGRENGIASIENSFKRLRTNFIELMFIHNMNDVDTHLPTLKDYKAKGRFRYIGVTSTGRNQDDLTKWMPDLDFVEFAYAVDTREAEKRLLPMAQDKGVAVLVALPLGRGRLLSAMKGKDVPEWAKKELGCDTFAQLLLKFVVSHPGVTAAIPGTNRPHHMVDNLGAARGPMPDAKQRERIVQLWENA